MARISLPIHSYNLRSTPTSPSRLVNCFIEQLPPDAKGPAYLARVPGIKAWTDITDTFPSVGSIQSMFQGLGALWVVASESLYKITKDKVVTLIGSTPGNGNVDIDSNTTTITVVNEPFGYTYDGTTFAVISDTDFTGRGAGDVEFLDDYMLFREPDTGRFFGSDLASATAFNALNFATAEAAPDDLVGMKVDHRQLILFGEKTTELWENTGASGFPFQRSINGLVEQGCLNGRTIAKLDNSVYWLADDFTVRRLEGITPIRVSQHAVEEQFRTKQVSTAQAYTYRQNGHMFYVLGFSDGTFVYDVTTQLWHERETYNDDHWLATSHASAFDKELVGDAESGKIGELDVDTYADQGVTQLVSFTYQPIYAEQQRAFHDRLEIVFEPGVGLTTGQGSDPEVMMEYSDDGGLTYDFLPRKKPGKIGEYLDRVIWNALGSARQRVYRGSLSDPVKLSIADTLVEVRGGRL